MKLIALVVLASSVAFAAGETKLNPRVEPDGRAHLGVDYFYDVSTAWSMRYSSDISDEALRSAPPSLKWNFLNMATGQYLQDWTAAGRSELQVGTLDLASIKPLFDFLPEMKSYRVVFADENLTPLYYFDIGELCAKYPQNFLDHTNTLNPPCEVSKAQLPDRNSECREHQAQFLDLMKRGLLTCKVANAQLVKRGCEPLNCE